MGVTEETGSMLGFLMGGLREEGTVVIVEMLARIVQVHGRQNRSVDLFMICIHAPFTFGEFISSISLNLVKFFLILKASRINATVELL